MDGKLVHALHPDTLDQFHLLAETLIPRLSTHDPVNIATLQVIPPVGLPGLFHQERNSATLAEHDLVSRSRVLGNESQVALLRPRELPSQGVDLHGVELDQLRLVLRCRQRDEVLAPFGLLGFFRFLGVLLLLGVLFLGVLFRGALLAFLFGLLALEE